MNVFHLKIIAAVTMLLDHFGAAVFSRLAATPGQFAAYDAMRSLGRIAFPIYAYLIAQGCLHTKNIGRYMLRLMLLALISEAFFDAAFFGGQGINFLQHTNIFYTLFLGVAAIALCEWIKKKLPEGPLRAAIPLVAVLPPMPVAWALSSDYGPMGVFLIFAIYIADPLKRGNRAAAMALALGLVYFPFVTARTAVVGINTHYLFALIAVLCVFFYNGKPGPRHAAVKWGFYFFYPVHIGLLLALRHIIYL